MAVKIFTLFLVFSLWIGAWAMPMNRQSASCKRNSHELLPGRTCGRREMPCPKGSYCNRGSCCCKKDVVRCLVDPCLNKPCPGVPDAQCVSDTCGDCNARYYSNERDVTKRCHPGPAAGCTRGLTEREGKCVDKRCLGKEGVDDTKCARKGKSCVEENNRVVCKKVATEAPTRMGGTGIVTEAPTRMGGTGNVTEAPTEMDTEGNGTGDVVTDQPIIPSPKEASNSSETPTMMESDDDDDGSDDDDDDDGSDDDDDDDDDGSDDDDDDDGSDDDDDDDDDGSDDDDDDDGSDDDDDDDDGSEDDDDDDDDGSDDDDDDK